MSDHLYALAVAFALVAGVAVAALELLAGYEGWWLGGLTATAGTLPIYLAIARKARSQ